ncbi:MAG: 5'/3'-nucleotidase SurE, partial [Deltaproteobacteria bacterium]
GGAEASHDHTEGTDTAAWDAGHASLTPLTLTFSSSEHADLANNVARHTTTTG